MNILIADYPNVMEEDYTLTVDAIKSIIPGAKIKTYSYTTKEEFYIAMEDIDGLITAFLPLEKEFFERAKKLKCISISAVGYANIDLEEAKKHNVKVCHIEEYCTEEVAEHTLALICELNRNLKYYTKKIEQEKEWKYHSIPGEKPLSSQKIAIFGFGKIGKRVAELAKAFGMKVLVVDPYITVSEAKKYGVRLVDKIVAFAQADIISNHMNLSKETYHFFNEKRFAEMAMSPLFINVGRGASVDEDALIRALDEGWIRGAGLDVLSDEKPNLEEHSLVLRDNVIITPHSAFYSTESIEKLQKISASNLAYCLTGKYENVKKIVRQETGK